MKPIGIAESEHPPAANPDVDSCCPPQPMPDVITRPLVDPAADAELAVFAKAIGHPVRVRILRMLAEREARTCSLIVDELPLAQSTVSEHLRILKAAGLVKSRENGPRVSYCIELTALRRLKALLKAI
jgi:ArsR family transcriptional regulator